LVINSSDKFKYSKKNEGSVFSRKHFALTVTVITLLLLFSSPVAKAQQDSVKTFDAILPAQSLPDGSTIIENNLSGNESEIRDELDVWEQDLGKEVTDGSYMGALFESSLFELDNKPLIDDDTYDVNSLVVGKTQPEDFFPFYTPLLYTEPYEFYNQTVSYAKRRSLLSVTNVVNFSSRVIMSGATEFYMKIPVDASIFNLQEATPTISIFKVDENIDVINYNLNNSAMWYKPRLSIMYDVSPYRWMTHDNGTIYDVRQGIGNIRKDLSGSDSLYPYYNGAEPDIIQSIDERFIVGNNVYAHIYGTIEPNTNYIVTLSAIIKEKPRIYLTEDDIASNGRNSYVQMVELPIELGYQYLDPNAEWTAFHGYNYILGTSVNISSPLINETIYIPVDTSFSFVFKSGRGSYGMFGQEIHFDKGDAIVFYEELDVPDSNKYISIMLPFISKANAVINVTASFIRPDLRFESQGDQSVYTGAFGYKNPDVWTGNKNITYKDYILFTIPYKINAELMSGSTTFTIKIMIVFDTDADVTFMFSTLDTAELTRTCNEATPRIINEVSKGNYPTYITHTQMRKNIAYVYRGVNITPYAGFLYTDKDGYDNFGSILTEWIGGIGNTFSKYSDIRYTALDYKDATFLNYKLFRSVQLTDGIWHQLVTTSEGYHYAEHFFERRVAIGEVIYWVDIGNNQTGASEVWYDEAGMHYTMAWESLKKGDIINAVEHLIRGTVSLMWNGLNELLGFIVGIFSKLGDFLVKIGEFVYSILTSFYDVIVSIINDIVSGIEQILNPAIYLVTLIVFMYVISWTGKILSIKRGASV